MRSSVPSALPGGAVDAERIEQFVNRELLPVARQMRDVLNFRSVERATVSTAGGGVWTRVWTSDAMPKNGVWAIMASVVGTGSGGSPAAAYEVRGAFNSAGGTVAQVGSTSTTVIGETAAACDVRFSVDAVNRQVYAEVRDDGASAMSWTAVVYTTEAVPT